MTEIIKKQSTQITTKSFQGNVSVQEIKSKINITLAKQQKSHFIDELEKQLLEIGDKLKKKAIEKLTTKNSIAQDKLKPLQEKVKAFDDSYDAYYKEINYSREQAIKNLSDEQEKKHHEIVNQMKQGNITEEQAKEQVLKNSEYYNQKRADLKCFRDLEEKYHIKESTSRYLDYTVVKKIVSDKFTDQEWTDYNKQQEQIKELQEEKDTLNKYYGQIMHSDFSYTRHEFSKLFPSSIKNEVDIAEDITQIQSKMEGIQKVILPVMYYYPTNAKAGEVVINVIKKLIWNTKFYGKKDDNTVRDVANAICEDIHEYSLYAITKGINQYIRDNTEFPTLKEIIDVIKPINDKCLVMYANIQFLLSNHEEA